MNLVSHLLTLVADNEFGVLTRITALIRREGWNIRGLSVAEMPGGLTSRLTLSLQCPENSTAAVADRLSRLNCVRSAEACSERTHAIAELALFSCTDGESAEAAGCFEVKNGVYGYCGAREEIDALVEKLAPAEMARSGEVAVRFGEEKAGE